MIDKNSVAEIPFMKKQLSQVLGKLHVIRIGDVLWVCDPTSRPEVVAKAEKALRSGTQIRWEDGMMEWLEFFQRIDSSKRGSQMYTWDRHGDKVLADVMRVAKTRAGRITKKKVGTRYVAP